MSDDDWEHSLENECDCRECEEARQIEQETEAFEVIKNVASCMKAGTLWRCDESDVLMLALEDCLPSQGIDSDALIKVLVLDGTFYGSHGVVELTNAELQYLEQYFP